MYRYEYERNNELYHYGVKGQKWGVRKKIERGLDDWTDNRRATANATLKRTKGNKDKAMVRTAARGVGRAVAVSIGSKAAGIALATIGGSSLGSVAVTAGNIAATAMLVNSGVEMYNISKNKK